MSHCIPCDIRFPSCENKTDGYYAYREYYWTPLYMECRKERFIAPQKSCSPSALGLVRLFSLYTRKCETLYEIPEEGGGHAACKNKPDGSYGTYENQCHAYFRCKDKKFVDIQQCPDTTVFDYKSQTCLPDVDVCGICGIKPGEW